MLDDRVKLYFDQIGDYPPTYLAVDERDGYGYIIRGDNADDPTDPLQWRVAYDGKIIAHRGTFASSKLAAVRHARGGRVHLR